jgi:hypothetical protein
MRDDMAGRHCQTLRRGLGVLAGEAHRGGDHVLLVVARAALGEPHLMVHAVSFGVGSRRQPHREIPATLSRVSALRQVARDSV